MVKFPTYALPLIGPKFLNWNRWAQADALMRNVGSATNQGERFHLYCIHTAFFPSIIRDLRRRLQVITNTNVTLTSECIWVDARPQAHWSDPNNPKLNVELADLLVEVTVQAGPSTTAQRRAMLLQAKWTDRWNDLGTAACHPGKNDSTNLERDLLEDHCGQIELFASSKTATPILDTAANPNANQYDVSKDVPAQDQKLISHARYLLFPKEQVTPGIPYLSLTPHSRSVGMGKWDNDYEDLLCRLALKRSNVPELKAGQQWTKLVDSIGHWADEKAKARKNVNRVGKKFPYRSSQLMTTMRPNGITPSCRGQAWVEPNSYLGSAEVFWGGRTGQPNGETASGEFRAGFWHIRINVEYSTKRGI